MTVGLLFPPNLLHCGAKQWQAACRRIACQQFSLWLPQQQPRHALTLRHGAVLGLLCRITVGAPASGRLVRFVSAGRVWRGHGWHFCTCCCPCSIRAEPTHPGQCAASGGPEGAAAAVAASICMHPFGWCRGWMETIPSTPRHSHGAFVQVACTLSLHFTLPAGICLVPEQTPCLRLLYSRVLLVGVFGQL